MLPTCEGSNDDINWETCRNILITDCQCIGTYVKSKKKSIQSDFFVNET